MSLVSRLKKQRDTQKQNIAKGLEDQQRSGGSNKDPNEWSPTFDKDKGTGTAVVRFLPWDADKLPWIKLYSHGFKGPTGKWYIENSLTTLGRGTPDPVSEMNSTLWNSGIESDKDDARKYKRKLYYYANVLVIKDPANKDNEGKVFKFRFGQKIMKMIEDQINPEFDDEDSCNPFDIIDGKNFTIKMKIVADYMNYDSSSFGEVCELADGDEDRMEEILGQTFDLEADYLGKDNFKSYDELRAKLFAVLGPRVGSGIATVPGWEGGDGGNKTEAPKQERSASPKQSAPVAVTTEDDEDLDALFNDILDED